MANHKSNKPEEEQDLRQQAIKFKAFQHTFSQKDIDKGLNEKLVLQKLKASEQLESSYNRYLKALEKNPIKPTVFPWDSKSRQFLYWFLMRMPRLFKWTVTISLLLVVINYLPGPTQHIAELILARAIYDTAGIARLPESLESYAHSAKIVDADGEIIKSYGKRKVTLKIPEQAKIALLACEDHYLLPHPTNPWYVNNFLIHAGVSWFNLAGAVKDTLLGNKRGASTIIMQNAKKILGNDQRTVANKLEEIIIAYMLVSKFGKEQNLDFYINTVPVGSNIYGFPAAAKNYFKKTLDELNLQQLVTIGSFIPNHNRPLAFYDIWLGKSFDELSEQRRLHAKAAIDKINLALGYLQQIKVIDHNQYKAWQLSDEESIRRIGLRDFHSPLYGEEEWTSWNVIKEVTARSYKVRERTISGAQLILDEKGDVVIETSVDVALVGKIKEIITNFLQDQKFRQILKTRNEKTWKKDLELYEKRRIMPPYSSFEEFMDYLYKHLNVGVVIINKEGRILAYIGGKEFLRNSDDDLVANEAGEPAASKHKNIIIDLMNNHAKVTPSSTIKPIIAYYSMLVDNASLQTTYPDKPLEYKYVEADDKKVWLPRNWYPYDGKGLGNNRYLGRSYTLLEAQVISINTIFGRLYSRPTIRSAMLSGFDKINLDYNHEDAKYWPFGIGASDVPVQQWLGVYNAFLDGYYRPPSFVKRITINNEIIYNAEEELAKEAVHLFDAKKERQDEMRALFEICNTGSGATMSDRFKYHKNLVSGKTGTAPNGRTSLFVSHFNPYANRNRAAADNMTMIVIVTTNTGGYKSVGTSTQGPTLIAGEIYDYLFNQELRAMMDNDIEAAKLSNSHFRNNHLYWANVNKYMDKLLHGSCGSKKIYEFINGVDGYQEALEQILNPNIQIYAGRDQLFEQLVEYYCDSEKLVKMKNEVQ